MIDSNATPPSSDAPAAPCQVCGAAGFASLVVQGDHHWWQCRGCEFAFLHPMPAAGTADYNVDAEVGQDYIGTYMTAGKYRRKLARSRRRARRLKRRMAGARMLDVGSNVGIMIEAAGGIGLEPSGIELNPTLVDFARERYPAHTFYCGTLEETEIAEPFDGAYCSEVIEHIPDNNPFVAALARALRPGGVLFLTTPGVHEYVAAGEPDGWRDFGAPDHKLYYSRENMRTMLEKHGFHHIRYVGRAKKGLKLFATRA